MTPQQFVAAYLPTAQRVSAGTGIDSFVLLAQWANETAWGAVIRGNNLGNIRCSPTSFCQYATLDDFADAAVRTFHNGYYPNVLAATTVAAQLAAIVASPWSSGHYGGSLQSFYEPLEALDLTPDQAQELKDTNDKTTEVWNLLRTGFHFGTNPRWIHDELEAIKTKVNQPEAPETEPAPVAPVDATIAADLHTIAAFLRKFGVA